MASERPLEWQFEGHFLNEIAAPGPFAILDCDKMYQNSERMLDACEHFGFLFRADTSVHKVLLPISVAQ